MFGFMTPDVVLTIVLQCTSIRVSHCRPSVHPCLRVWSVDDKSQAGTSITSTNHMFGFMTPDVVLTIVLQCTSIRV